MKMPWMYYENKLKKWKRTSGHIVNLDLNTSTPFELPSRPLLLQRSIRIGGKKKPQDDKREINIEVYIVLLLNEMKRNVKDDERNETLNWIRDYTISELLDHWNSGRKLNQYRPGCFFSNPVASHLMILINSTSTALWISSNVKLLNFESQH